jgi:hypothetical protein
MWRTHPMEQTCNTMSFCRTIMAGFVVNDKSSEIEWRREVLLMESFE